MDSFGGGGLQRVDDYLPIPSAAFRFAVAFLQADAGGERVRDALERSVPPDGGAGVRVSFLGGRIEPPGAVTAEVRGVADRFGQLLPGHLISRGVRPELLREVGVEAVRGRSGRLRYSAVARDDLGRWYGVQVVLPEGLPVGFVIGDGPCEATPTGRASDAEPLSWPTDLNKNENPSAG